MSTPRLEHVNVTVSNPERAARLMEELFGWQVRWKGPARDGGHTIHIGSKEHYLALYTGRNVAYTADDFATATALVADADLGRLVTATYPLARYRDAIDHAANAGARGAVKVAFDLRNEKERNR